MTTVLFDEAVARLGCAPASCGEDPGQAIALWRTLMAGRYSLIDTRDHDGKRCLLARRNEPDTPAPAAVSVEERAVLARFALGQSGKQVAYELGVSPSTVSARLQRGLRKLGLRTVAELRRTCAGASSAAP
jgi:DNA-binding NarL/FixJ family response regulator